MARIIEKMSPETLEAMEKAKSAVLEVQTLKESGEVYTDKDGAFDKAKEAVKALNESLCNDCMGIMEAEFAQSMEEGFRAYIKDWAVMGYSISDSDDGIVFEQNKAIRIKFSALDRYAKTTRICRSGDWWNKAKIFGVNCARYAAVRQHKQVAELPASLASKQKSLGKPWTDDNGSPMFSKNALVKQYNEVVHGIVPKGITCIMNGACVEGLTTAILQHDKQNQSSADKLKNNIGATLEETMFQQIYSRIMGVMGSISDDLHRASGEDVAYITYEGKAKDYLGEAEAKSIADADKGVKEYVSQVQTALDLAEAEAEAKAKAKAEAKQEPAKQAPAQTAAESESAVKVKSETVSVSEKKSA